MIVELRSEALEGSRGTVRYRPEFGQLDAQERRSANEGKKEGTGPQHAEDPVHRNRPRLSMRLTRVS